MLSQLSQAEASWVIGSIGIDLMDSSSWFKFRDAEEAEAAEAG